MKFYNRTEEIAEMQRIKEMAYIDHSKLTVLIGRRRIGKTSLILNALKNETIVCLFVSRKSEADLCAGFCGEIEKQIKLPPFTTTVLKEILKDYKPDYTKDELLSLYT
jgi:uncharacterized protein